MLFYKKEVFLGLGSGASSQEASRMASVRLSFLVPPQHRGQLAEWPIVIVTWCCLGAPGGWGGRRACLGILWHLADARCEHAWPQSLEKPLNGGRVQGSAGCTPAASGRPGGHKRQVQPSQGVDQDLRVSGEPHRGRPVLRGPGVCSGRRHGRDGGEGGCDRKGNSSESL